MTMHAVSTRVSNGAGEVSQEVVGQGEALVADVRAGLRPSQMVERKLMQALTRDLVFRSQVRATDVGNTRRRL